MICTALLLLRFSLFCRFENNYYGAAANVKSQEIERNHAFPAGFAKSEANLRRVVFAPATTVRWTVQMSMPLVLRPSESLDRLCVVRELIVVLQVITER